MPELFSRWPRGRRTSRLVAAVAVSMIVVACVAPASCAAVITVGNHTLLPDTPNQQIQITISGAEAVAAEDFYAQIGDGGTFNGGTNTRPVFQNVDVLTGTIFGTNNTGPRADPTNPSHRLIWVDGTSTQTGSVTPSGLLATLTVDTSGVTSGTFPLLLSGVASNLGGFNTDLIDANSPTGATIPLTITNGNISVPEPASLGGLGAVGLLLLRRARRTAGR